MNPIAVKIAVNLLVAALPYIVRGAQELANSRTGKESAPAFRDPNKDEGLMGDVVGLMTDIASNPRTHRILKRLSQSAASKRAA